MEPISPSITTHSSPCGASTNKDEDNMAIDLSDSINTSSLINNQDENIYINQFYQNNLLNGFEIELIPIGDKRNYFSNAYPPEIDHIIDEDNYIKLINNLNKAYYPLYLYIATTICILVSLGSVYPFVKYHNYSLDLTCTLIVIIYVITCYMIYRTFYPPMINGIIKHDIKEQLDKINKKYNSMLLTLEVKQGEQYGKTKDNITIKITVHPLKSINVNDNISYSTPPQPPSTPIDIISIPVLPPPFNLNSIPTSPKSPTTPQQHNKSYIILSPKSISGESNNQLLSPKLTNTTNTPIITPQSPQLQLPLQQQTIITIPVIEISEPVAA